MQKPARILLFSQRNLYEPEVWRCSFYEFEQILSQIDTVETLAPKPKKWFYQRRSNAMRIGKISSIVINPGIPKIQINRYYDLFFAVCEKPSELLNLSAIEGIKDYCKTSICWLTEFYVREMREYKSALKVLSKFDHVIFMFDKSEPFMEIMNGRGSYLPAGIDAISFCPYPKPPTRFIDVLSIGRRSKRTHQVLLSMAQNDDFLYIYDTLDNLHTYSIPQHRFLMSKIAKRSRYFIVNPGKVDSPGETGGQSEFGYRYFEGSAPGTIIIGDVPNNKEFRKYFDWPDAVIHLSFGSEEIESIIKDLDTQPDRQMRIRRNNVIQSLMRHDWVYRWEAILKIAGLEPLSGLLKRRERLMNLANIVENESGNIESMK